MFGLCQLKIDLCLIPVLKTERKGTPMNSYRFSTFQLLVSQNSLLRIYMWTFHDVARQVGSDGQDCQVKGPKEFTNFLEYFTVSCISRVENLLTFRSLDHEPSPKSVIFLIDFPLGPMANRNKSYLEGVSIDIDFFCLGPVHFYHFAPLWKLTFRI